MVQHDAQGDLHAVSKEVGRQVRVVQAPVPVVLLCGCVNECFGVCVCLDWCCVCVVVLCVRGGAVWVCV